LGLVVLLLKTAKRKMNPQGKYDSEIYTNLLKGLQVPSGKGKEAVWNELFEKLEKTEQKPTIPLWKTLSRIAAIIIGLLLLSNILWYSLLSNSKFYSNKGEHLVVLLPDSSEVTLNADSHISYNKAMWKYSRKVSLKGEALFKVKKGKQFSVKTGSVTTQVLGTTFNIYARNNNICVSCIEGKVEVRHSKTQQTFILEPKQVISSSTKNLVAPQEVELPHIAQWVKGEFFFNKVELSTVLAELERQYNVKVKLSAGHNRLYTGVFFLGNLPQALNLICIPMGLSWQQQDRTVIISSQ
jgi:ferric-dicitrate binding protein FerR (iron transport regulator)